MTERLKKILFEIAGLSASDQIWILKNLTTSNRRVFRKYEGIWLLKTARSFYKKNYVRPVKTKIKSKTLSFWQDLSDKNPRYTAIVLHEGQFTWTMEFLNHYDSKNKIRCALDDIQTIKPTVRQQIFKQWSQNIHG